MIRALVKQNNDIPAKDLPVAPIFSSGTVVWHALDNPPFIVRPDDFTIILDTLDDFCKAVHKCASTQLEKFELNSLIADCMAFQHLFGHMLNKIDSSKAGRYYWYSRAGWAGFSRATDDEVDIQRVHGRIKKHLEDSESIAAFRSILPRSKQAVDFRRINIRSNQLLEEICYTSGEISFHGKQRDESGMAW